MKVNGTHPQPTTSRVAATAPREAVNEARGPEQHASEGADQVHVSEAGRKLATTRAPQQVDDAKVAELRGRVQAGKLQIDLGRIADVMLREER